MENYTFKELYDFVGSLVKVDFLSADQPIVGTVYTVDPESRSLVIIQTDNKNSPEWFVLVPSRSILRVICLDDQQPNECVSNVNQTVAVASESLQGNESELQCAPDLSTASQPVGTLTLDPLPIGQKKLRNVFWKMFRTKDEEQFLLPRVPRSIEETKRIFDDFYDKRRARILEALNKNKVPFEEEESSTSIISTGHQQHDVADEIEENIEGESEHTRHKTIVIGQLKIRPPFGENDLACSRPDEKLKILRLLKSENVF